MFGKEKRTDNAVNDDYLPIRINALKTLLDLGNLPLYFWRNIFLVLNSKNPELEEVSAKIFDKFLPDYNQLFISLKENYDVPEKFIFLNKEKSRIEIGLWILEKIALKLKMKGCKCFMVEEYPTADRLEVERIPLPI